MFAGSAQGRPRLFAIGVVIVAVLLVQLVYLFYLQVVSGFVYAERAGRIVQRSAIIEPPHGRILDRTGKQVLASDKTLFQVEIVLNAQSETELRRVTQLVAEWLDMPVAPMLDGLESAMKSGRTHATLAESLTLESIVVLAEHRVDLPGIGWRERFVRDYSDAELFAHVIGYVGAIAPSELQLLYNQGYRVDSRIGKAGVERMYDIDLRGSAGTVVNIVDAFGRTVENEPAALEEPEPGNDIVLTLDAEIQRLVFEAIGNRVGAAVVLRPATGEVLAMVSKPAYDANRFRRSGGKSYFTEVSLDPRGAFINRAIEAEASPASTFKVIMMTAIIEDDAFPVNKTIFDPGYYKVGDRIFLCHKKYGHGDVALFEALVQSCNTYFYIMGNEYLGVETIVE